MAKIKKGTYRFNDVLSAQSFTTADYSEPFSFTFTVPNPETSEEEAFECDVLTLNANGTVDYYITSYELGFRQVYNNGWLVSDFGEGIQTITIPKDTDVSDEFGSWFTANTKAVVEGKPISGKWTFKDVITCPSEEVVQNVNFTTELSAEEMTVLFECDQMRAWHRDDVHLGGGVIRDGDYLVYRVTSSSMDLEVELPYDFGAFALDGDFTGWANNALKTIDFGDTPQYVSAEFYSWLIDNTERSGIRNLAIMGQLIDKANAVTGKADADLTSGVASLIEGYGQGGGLAINGIIEQYKVNAGASVNAGDFVEFVNKFNNGTFCDNAVSNYKGVSACKLDNTHVLVVYADSGNSHHGTAVILAIGENGIDLGTSVVFETKATSYISAVALTDSKVLVAYADSGNSDEGTAVVLTIDGTTISVGTSVVFEALATSYISAVALTDSKVLVAYTNEKGKAIILNVDGTTIIAGTAITFTEYQIGWVSTVALTENKVIVAYHNVYSRLYEGIAVVLTISATNITKGTETTFRYDKTNHIHTVALTESKVMVFFADVSNSWYGTAVVLTIDGTTISVGTSVVFEALATSYISAVALTDSKVLAAYSDWGNSKYGTAVILTVDDTEITASTPIVFDYNETSFKSVIAFSETSVLVAYNNGTGAFSNLLIDGTTITADGAEVGTYIQPATSRLHNVGIASTSGTEGETVDVYVVG